LAQGKDQKKEGMAERRVGQKDGNA